MKQTIKIGFGALVVLTALAFFGATSAMAESTSLCSEDAEGEECPSVSNQISHVHSSTLSGAKATLLNSISNVLCDVLFLGDTTSEEGSGSPLVISGNLTYTNCVDEKPNSCTVTEVSKSSTIEIFKEGHETASVFGEGEVKVVCSGISCTYNGKGLEGTEKGPLLSSETNGSVSIVEQTVNKVKGLLCPSTGKLHATVTPLSPTYLTGPETTLCEEDGGEGESTTCGSHQSHILHLHANTLEGAKATLLNSISNVLCDVLFLGDTTSEEGSGSPLVISGNLTYTNCVDEKPNSCTVTEVSENTTLRFLREGNEQAEVTFEGEINLGCSGLIFCYYNWKEQKATVKGPLLSSETNGEMAISEKAMNKVKGSFCPSTTKLDITITPLSPTYITL